MKKSYILKASLLMGVMVTVSSCREETINYLDASAVPQASDYAIKVSVNPETNEVSLNLTDASGNDAKGVYPVWRIYTKSTPVKSTRPIYNDIIAAAGDYDVEAQVGNHNGVSDGVLTSTIHIENTIMDFSPIMKVFTDDASKIWQIAANTQSHLACGEPGTDGTNWWSAQPYEKADWGVYDNRMTFTNNGGNGTGLYTYDPGASGTVYVNTGITDLSPISDANTNDGLDYMAPVDKQEDVPFMFTVEGVDLFLVLPAGTLMAYLPNVELYNEPKWKVNSYNKNAIELTCSNNDIAWHYILQPEGADAGDKPFEGFKYDSEFNLLKDAPLELDHIWMADDNWGEIPGEDPVISDGVITIHTPAGIGSSQWQGQLHVKSGLVLSSGTNYDFSMKLNSNVDSEITVKLVLAGGGDNDNIFLCADKQKFDAGGSYYYFSDVPGFDGDLMLVFDFAGYPDTDFEISKLVLKDHANDDGTVLPSDTPPAEGEPEEDVDWISPDDPSNLWNVANVSEITSWTSPSDWSGSTPEPEISQEGNAFTIQYSEAPGGDQWMAQVVYHTDLAFSGDKTYDFSVVINPSCDITGATVKPTVEDDDNTFWSDARHDLEAFEDNVIKLVGVKADIPQFKLVFDFAGVQENAKVVIKDIIIQEHHEFVWNDVDSDANLWNGTTEITSWTSPSDWSGSTPEPEITQDGNTYTVQYSEAPGGDQWMAQVVFHTNQSYSGDKAYDFRVVINPSCDIAGATVKPTQEDNDGVFWSEGRHDLEAFEDNVIELKNVQADLPQLKLVFDFAGVEANAKVVIKDILIQEHQ